MRYGGPERRAARPERLVGGTVGATAAGLLAWWMDMRYGLKLPSGLEAGLGGSLGVIGACMHPYFTAGGRLVLAMMRKCSRGKEK